MMNEYRTCKQLLCVVLMFIAIYSSKGYNFALGNQM